MGMSHAAKPSGQTGLIMEGGLGQRHLSLMGFNLRLIAHQSLLGREGGLLYSGCFLQALPGLLSTPSSRPSGRHLWEKGCREGGSEQDIGLYLSLSCPSSWGYL